MPIVFNRLHKLLSIAALLFCCSLTAYAQGGFVSGSTGADGAFAPTSSQTIQIPESGVFNYTTINIPAGVEIRYKKNSKSTPVVILASGDVTISGTISVSGENAADGNGAGPGGIGGPGGFNGGRGGIGVDSFSGTSGDGPGAGSGGAGSSTTSSGGGGAGYSAAGASGTGSNATVGQGGSRYGSSLLLPLIGGSGGGGGGTATNGVGGGGGGGGGAILIASSGTIKFVFTNNAVPVGINAEGGRGSSGATFAAHSGGGSGSGGAIRLIANAITGQGRLSTFSQTGNNGGGAGATGFIRAEAFDFTGFTPLNSSSISFGAPNPIFLPTNTPQLRIASVGGVASPTSPSGSFNATADIVVPSSTSNPVSVVVSGSNMPTGTLVDLTLIPEVGQRSIAQSSMQGSPESLSGTAQMTLPQGMCVIIATATVELPSVASNKAPIFINGEKVDRIEVTSTFGGEAELTYITNSGKRLKLSDLH